jgi:hypothetical protein
METILDEELPRSRLAGLLKHFSQIEDGRESWRPSGGNAAACDLRKIADCDDFDEIVGAAVTWIFLRHAAVLLMR